MLRRLMDGGCLFQPNASDPEGTKKNRATPRGGAALSLRCYWADLRPTATYQATALTTCIRPSQVPAAKLSVTT